MEKWTREDMERDYPYFRRFVYDKLGEHFDKVLPPLEGDDLREIGKQMNARPIDLREFDVDEV